MHNKKLKRVWASLMAATMIVPILPTAQVFGASGESAMIYENDFEKEASAEDIGGNKALGFELEGDINNSWLTVFQQDLYYEYADQINAGATLSFDLIIPEKSTFTGVFKAQAVAKMGNDWTWTQCETIPEIAVSAFTSMGNGYKSANVSISFGKEIEQIKGLKAVVPCLAASNCDYKGKIYLDNVKLTNGKAAITEPVIVEATQKVKTQTAIKVNANSIVSNGKQMNTSKEVKLVDDKAVDSVAQLYAYLEAVGKSDSVLYGHQNDTHHKAGNKKLSNSDTKDVTGSISAVVGIDTLSLAGNEFPGGLENQYPTSMTSQQRIEACAKMNKEAVAEGAIITVSAHMPNFTIIADRIANKPGKDGTLDWTKADFLSEGNNVDGSWVTSGDVVQKIMPGGKLNYLFNAYLDMIAAYAEEMGDTPILLRPFHENTGSWFWWGAAFCDEEAYKNLYKYTVDYLRDTKQIHNILYVYGPGSEAESVTDYAKRYPGDDYVDMVGFDMYHQYPAEGDSFIANFKKQLIVVEQFAQQHNKLFAVTETGISNGNEVLLKGGNERKDWYNEVLEAIAPSSASYFLLWANFGTNSGYYTPYVTEKTEASMKGHEMLDNFIDFYNNSKSVFAAQVGDLNKLSVKVKDNTNVTGYITYPTSGSRILDTTTIKASVNNVIDTAKVNFTIKNKAGKVVKTLAATKDASGAYVSELTKAELKKVGETTGTINLTVEGKEISKINGKFNMPEPVYVPTVVDTFDDYYGDNEVLNTSWSIGKGTGCTLAPSLSDKKYAGKYGLEFKYNLVAGGYIGVTKSLNNVDWSKQNALQLWTIPDGKNKKVVIQVTSGGNVFEVYLNDYEAYNKATGPILVTIPFSSFVGRDDANAVFDSTKIEGFGLWCNTILPEEADADTYKLTGSIYYDDIKAITSKETSISFTKK